MVGKQGRPIGSAVRQNIVELLYFMGEGYAYDIFRHYSEVFPKVSMRSIYYHLKKGTITQEFIVKGIKNEAGTYSWGDHAEKVFYALGPSAAPLMNSDVKSYFASRPADK